MRSESAGFYWYKEPTAVASGQLMVIQHAVTCHCDPVDSSHIKWWIQNTQEPQPATCKADMCLSCEPTSLSPCPVKIHSRTRETNTINVSKAIINQPYKLMVLYHLLMVNWGWLVYYCFTIGLDPIPKQAFLGEHLVLEGRDWWNQGEPSRFNMLFDSHICWRVL